MLKWIDYPGPVREHDAVRLWLRFPLVFVVNLWRRALYGWSRKAPHKSFADFEEKAGTPFEDFERTYDQWSK